MLQHEPALDDFSGLNYQPLIDALQGTDLQRWVDALHSQITENLSLTRYGDLPRWLQALQELPAIDVDAVDLNSALVSVLGRYSDPDALREQLKQFHPWRKGPFCLAGVEIDTEWRSDLKWSRVVDAIEPLAGRTVLDVGCGSGYHCWRMGGENAALTIGIEPTPLFVMQYWVLQRYIQNPRVWVVPQRIEQVPNNLRAFDTVFSMGILYHRRSPFEHLQSLREALRSGGQLVLETLVIDESAGDCLVPVGRYAKMGNVWFIPSVSSLTGWLTKMKFRDVQLVDVSVTSLEEQRSTEWMTFESLSDFLDPVDRSKTIEGYPAPRRAVLTATAP
ncbi:MAG: tRNA 5-methoxyuridine(34)/uridine 5-oxyacetic acid(34) synthase CmoB [Pseudomonadales bacterium]